MGVRNWNVSVTLHLLFFFASAYLFLLLAPQHLCETLCAASRLKCLIYPKQISSVLPFRQQKLWRAKHGFRLTALHCEAMHGHNICTHISLPNFYIFVEKLPINGLLYVCIMYKYWCFMLIIRLLVKPWQIIKELQTTSVEQFEQQKKKLLLHLIHMRNCAD